MRPHVPPLVLTLALAAGMLVGCSDDPKPVFTEPSPTVTSSPSSQAPEPREADEPKAWEENSADGAIAFAKHWTQTFSEAFRSGDTTDLKSLGTKSCDSCNQLLSIIEDVYENGGLIEGDDWRFTSPGVVRTPGTRNEISVTGLMRVSRQTVTKTGEKPEITAAGTVRFNFFLERRNGSWVSTRISKSAP